MPHSIKTAGFTIVELLVVIGIIALLSAMVVVSISSSQKDSRDAKRLADMAQIQKALRIYHSENSGVFPGPVATYGEGGAAEGCSNWDTSAIDRDSSGITMLDPLVELNYLSAGPIDPSNSTTCSGFQYRYYLFTAGTNGCDSARGNYYVLGVVNMENSTGTHPKSPGFSCSGHDWQTDFEWVAGGYTI